MNHTDAEIDATLEQALFSQEAVDRGTFLHAEGAVGRAVMDMLRSQQVRFPLTSVRDAYGQAFPSHFEIWSGVCKLTQVDASFLEEYRAKWDACGNPVTSSSKKTKVEIPQSVKDLSIRKIAHIVRADWKNVYFGAVPYLEAMEQLKDPVIGCTFCADTGVIVVLYFLSNASTWKGPVAKIIKEELKRRCK